MNSISPNLNIMIKACEKASKVIIRDFGELENLQVKKKGPKDFVTKTDKRVEKILIEELTKSKKNYSFITEETGIINNSDKLNNLSKNKNKIFSYVVSPGPEAITVFLTLIESIFTAISTPVTPSSGQVTFTSTVSPTD